MDLDLRIINCCRGINEFIQKKNFMKKRIISFLIISSLIFAFVIFYKGLNKSSFYQPKSEIEEIPKFFKKDKYYLLNIWASWCVPCRDEHPILISLSENKNLDILGLNYKDKISNAEKFLDELGNPYKEILLDQDGTIAIEWGAFGVPETFLIYQNRIVKKYIGPLNQNSFEEIEQTIK